MFKPPVYVLSCSLSEDVEDEVWRACEGEADRACVSFTGSDIASSSARTLVEQESQIRRQVPDRAPGVGSTKLRWMNEHYVLVTKSSFAA